MERGESELFMISNERDFEARAKKNKRIHIFAIKPRKSVEKMPKGTDEIFRDMVIIFGILSFTQ
jgi:hypothetical protein